MTRKSKKGARLITTYTEKVELISEVGVALTREDLVALVDATDFGYTNAKVSVKNGGYAYGGFNPHSEQYPTKITVTTETVSEESA